MKKPIEKWSFASQRASIEKKIVKNFGLRGLKIAHVGGLFILGFELILFGKCYWEFHMMNKSQDHRKLIHQQFPMGLDAFYWTAEKFHSNNDVRKNDYKAWGVRLDSDDC